MSDLKEVIIYTDGASQGNPGPGGYRRTTNNRMELMGVIAGLQALKTKCKVTIHSDSKYVVKIALCAEFSYI